MPVQKKQNYYFGKIVTTSPPTAQIKWIHFRALIFLLSSYSDNLIFENKP